MRKYTIGTALLLIAFQSHGTECAPLVNPICKKDEYIVQLPRGAEDGGPISGDCNTICLPDDLAPPPPTVVCQKSLELFECEVWPQGPLLTYIWVASSGVELLSTTLIPQNSIRTPYQAFICTQTHDSGHATIAVGSPGDSWSQRDFVIPCSLAAELPSPTPIEY